MEQLIERINNTNGLEEIARNINKPKHFNECLFKTNQFPFLNEYIEEYIKVHGIGCCTSASFIFACAFSNDTSTGEIVRILLKHNIDVNCRMNGSWTALMFTARHLRSTSSEETLKILLDHGADINARTDYGRTSLMFASTFSRTTSSLNAVKILLDHNADANIRDICGTTALMLSLSDESDENTIDLLLEHGSNINLKDNDGNTVVMRNIIAQGRSVENLVKLMKYNPNLNLKNNDNLDCYSLAFIYPNLNNGRSVIDILLPTRLKFMNKIKLYKNKRKFQLHKSPLGDYKNFPNKIISFSFIISYL